MSDLPWFISDPLAALEAYKNPTNLVVLDYETSNLDKGSPLNPDNHIVLSCWWVVTPDGITRKSRHADEYDLEELEKDIRKSQFVVAHNAKFELGWMKRMGIDLRDVLVFDTYLAEWVIKSNLSSPTALGLNAVARSYGLKGKRALSSFLIKAGVCPSIIPKKWLLDYCDDDVYLAYNIFLKQMPILVRDNLLHLVLVRNLTCACLADIEFNGCHLDKDRVLEEYDKTTDAYVATKKELGAIAGTTNLRSGKQLAELLYTNLGFSPPVDPRTKEPIKTGKGALATDSATLAKLSPKTDDQSTFLTLYKKINKLSSLITKNLEFFKGIVEEYGSVFYSVFNQGFTSTGRLSASGRVIFFKREGRKRGAQSQNLPREYKKLFEAHDPDYLVGEADGAALEFRVAADMGNDVAATKAICEGEDIHTDTANTLLSAGEPGFKQMDTKQRRQAAKSNTFSPMYGGNGKTPATKAYAQFFRAKYHGIFETQRGWTMEVLNTGKLVTPYGMRFYWPDTRMKASGYIDNTTSIFNYPIQGFATGEIIPIALVYFWHRTRDHRITIWITVHDSIGSRLHKDDAEVYEQLSKQALTTDVYWFLDKVYNYQFKVPLGVGIKIGTHWGESEEEVVYSVWPDGRETRIVKT